MAKCELEDLRLFRKYYKRCLHFADPAAPPRAETLPLAETAADAKTAAALPRAETAAVLPLAETAADA